MNVQRAGEYGPRTESDLKRIVLGRLPGFVYSARREVNEGGYLPIFVFHTLEAGDFERKLRYLKDNGYQTIDMDTAVAHLAGPAPGSLERTVALTIDDGRLSTWAVAEPLLEQYGMVATAFVIPGYLGTGPTRPTLRDVPFDLDEIDDRQTMMRWSEVQAMHERGIVRIESHTTLHRWTVTDWTPVRFVRPDFDEPTYLVPLPIDRHKPWTMAAEDHESLWGMPMPKAQPILALEAGLGLPDSVVEACQELVRTRGQAFFDQPDWKQQLTDRYRTALAETGIPEPIDLGETQQWELAESKRMLEEKLPGKTVKHLCLPNSLGNERSIRFATQIGYQTCLWGTHDAGTCNRPGHDPMLIGRLKHDYIWSLPGSGRSSVATVFCQKVGRRLAGKRGY